jgi:glycosyltransferase involved in cell wall biosynthesis
MPTCEARVITYKRPQLLKRALQSLIDQTLSDWQAIIFDNSPEQEGRGIVESFNDHRLIYRPHQRNLGKAKNIDLAFQTKPYLGGKYAFTLEDDNYLMPSFIEENIEAIAANKVAIILRNQAIRYEENGESVDRGETTRARWFSQGKYEPLEVYARIFFCEGISNGGLFWQTESIRSNLQVGSPVDHPLHQELLRTLQIEEPIFFEPEPLCVHTYFPRRPEDNVLKYLASKHKQLQYSRGLQSILIFLEKRHGKAVIDIADQLAKSTDAGLLLEQRLLKMLYLKYDYSCLRGLRAMGVLSWNLLRYYLLKDPYQRHLQT